MPDSDFGSVLYGDITKVDDDKRIVEGFISGDGCDLGGHIIDQNWLKKALPSWVAKWGNVREMHTASAVGTVAAVDVQDKPRPWVSARIVDDNAWKKIKAGVYKGFSVGIKNPVVIPDSGAPLGRVVGGDFLELSVVDRPAHPEAVITLFKIAPGISVRDEQLGVVLENELATAAAASEQPFHTATKPEDLQKMSPDQRKVWEAIRSEYGTIATAPDIANAAAPAAPTQNELGVLKLQLSNQLPYLFGQPGAARTKAALTFLANSQKLPMSPDIAKTVGEVLGVSPDIMLRDYTTDERKKYADSGIALPDGSFPIPDAGAVEDALHRLHEATDKKAAAAHIRKRAKELGVKLPASIEASVNVVADGVGALSADIANAAKIVHPHSGAHAHSHTHPGFPPGVSHTHSHSHNEDDMHEHDHVDDAGSAISPDDVVSNAAADSLKSAALPDVAKSDPSFGYATPAALPTLQKLESSLETLMKEVRAQMESLAGQTDKDRDGDIDTPKNMGPNGTGGTSGPAADFKSQFPAPPVASTEKLPLQMSPTPDLGSLYPDLAKSIDALVSRRVDEALKKISPTTQPAGIGPMTADVAKAAAMIAKEVGRLADGMGVMADEQSKLKTEAEALAARQAKVEQLAQPVRGQAAPVDKIIGLEQPGLTKAAPKVSLDDLVSQAQSLDPEKRSAAVQAMISAIYAERQLAR